MLYSSDEWVTEHASHFRYKVESVIHLVEFESDVLIKAFPTHGFNVFKRNLDTLNAFQTIILSETTYWLELREDTTQKQMEELRQFCIRPSDIFSSNRKT